MTERDQLIAELHKLREELAAMPKMIDLDYASQGDDSWQQAEQKRIEKLDVKALHLEVQKAEEEDASERRRKRTLELLRGRNYVVRAHALTALHNCENTIRGELMPPALAEAIAQQKRVEWDQTENVIRHKTAVAAARGKLAETQRYERAGYRPSPSSPEVEEEIDASEERLERANLVLENTKIATNQLEKLVLTPTAEVNSSITKILTEAHARQLALHVQPTPKPKPKPKQKAAVDSGEYAASPVSGVRVHDGVVEASL